MDAFRQIPEKLFLKAGSVDGTPLLVLWPVLALALLAAITSFLTVGTGLQRLGKGLRTRRTGMNKNGRGDMVSI